MRHTEGLAWPARARVGVGLPRLQVVRAEWRPAAPGHQSGAQTADDAAVRRDGSGAGLRPAAQIAAEGEQSKGDGIEHDRLL